MRTGLTKQEKTTDIWFDEEDSLIHIRTHNTDLKKRLAAYAGQYPDQCRPDDPFPVRAVFIVKNAVFSKSRAGENIRKMPLLRNKGEERSLHENRAYQAGKDHRYMV